MALFDRHPPRPLIHLDEAAVAVPTPPTPTPMLDQHLDEIMKPVSPKPIVDLLKAQLAPTPKETTMDPIMIAKLVMMGLGLIMDLVKALKQGDGADDVLFANAGDFLANIGSVAKVKELNGENIAVFMPEIRNLISKVHELRKLGD